MSSKILHSKAASTADELSKSGKKTGNVQKRKETPRKKPWKDYEVLGDNVLMIRGSYAQTSSKFGFISRDKQSAACCAVAPGYARLYPVADWTSTDLDKILMIGDQLYRTTIQMQKLKQGTEIKPQCMFPNVFIDSTKITNFIGKDVFIAPLANENWHVLEENIMRLLNSNDAVILNSGRKNCSIWKNEEFLYCFCPHDVDKTGFPTGPNRGCSVMFRTLNLEHMAEFIFAIMDVNLAVYSLKIMKIKEYNREYLSALMQNESRESLNKFSWTKVLEFETRQEEGSPHKELPDKFITPPDEPGSEVSPINLTKDFSIWEENKATLVCNTYIQDPKCVTHANVSALLYLQEIKSHLWTSDTLTDIVICGYSISENNPNFLVNRFSVTNTESITLNPSVFGKKDISVLFNLVVFGNIRSSNKNVLDLEKGLKLFFEKHDSGLLEGPQNVAFWQENNYYFLFDAKERDRLGRKWTKLGSTELGDDKSRGSACLSCYKNIADLIEVYIANINQKHRDDPFRLINVEYFTKELIGSDWHKWTVFGNNKWILRGLDSVCSYSDSVTDPSALALCVAAVTGYYVRLKPESDWTMDTINSLLHTGFNLHKQSVEMIINNPGEEEADITPTLQISDIKNKIEIEGKIVSLVFEEATVVGYVMPRVLDKEAFDLVRGLQAFFEGFNFGILSISSMRLAIWVKDDHYFMMDAFERNISGQDGRKCPFMDTNPNWGAACAMRFAKLGDMADTILGNVYPDKSLEFCITRVSYKVSGDNESPFRGNFVEFANEALILSAPENIHEENSAFGGRGGRQTLCNLIICLGLTHIHKAVNWTKEDIFDILRLGPNMFCDIINKMDDCQDRKFRFDWIDLQNPINVGGNQLFITHDDIVGVFVQQEANDQISPKEEEPAVIDNEEIEEVGDEASVKVALEDLRSILEEWEKSEYAEVILQSPLVNVACWKQDEVYFIFDPKACNEKGANISQIDQPRFDEQNKHEALDKSNFIENGEGRLNKGAAYVACFFKLDSLIEHILSKIPNEYRSQKFTLSRLTLKCEPEPTVNPNENTWFGFHSVFPGCHWIMRATTSQNDLMFSNRTKQDVTNCIVSLAFALTGSPDKYSTTLLDIILKYGDRLYTKSFEKITKRDPQFACFTGKLDLNKVVTSFSIHKVNFKYEVVKTVSGGLRSFDSPNKPSEDFHAAIADLDTIESNHGGILTYQNYHVAIWKTQGSIFMFDPHATSPSGIRSCNGVACLSRFEEIAPLFQSYVQKFECGPGLKLFDFHTIKIMKKFEDEEMKLCDAVAMNATTKEGSAFTPINRGIKILRSPYLGQDAIPKLYMSLVGLVFSQVVHVDHWTDYILKQITYLAWRLFQKSEKHGIQPEGIDKVSIDEMPRTFKLNNIRFNFGVDEVLRGSFNSNSKIGNMTIKSCLNLTLRSKNNAIIHIDEFIASVWREHETNYMFYLDSTTKELILVAADFPDLLHEWLKDNNIISYEKHWYEIIKVNISGTTESDNNIPRVDNVQTGKPWQQIELSKFSFFRKGNNSTTCTSLVLTPPEILRAATPNKKITLMGNQYYFEAMKASCLIAAAMAHIEDINKWTPNTLDVVINSGLVLYMNSIAVKRVDYLEITELEQHLYISNMRVKIVALAPIKEHPLRSNMLSAINYILGDYNSSYIKTISKCFTVIKVKENYYLFDPDYSANGSKASKHCQFASLFKYDSIGSSLDHVLNKIINTTDQVYIGPISVSLNY